MKHLLVITYLGLAVLFITFGILAYRNDKKILPIQKEQMAKIPLPWWFFLGMGLSLFLIIGEQVPEPLKLIGFLLLFIMIGLKWTYLRQPKQ